MKVNPIYKKELKASSRSSRLPISLMVFNGILARSPCSICIRSCIGCGQLQKSSILDF